MSDSDDTDVLLLIPPDFFLVHTSDSEDSIGPEVQKRYSECEKLVVNDLISQVNELENRISVVETKNSIDLPRNVWETSCLHQFFDCAAYLGFSAYQQLGPKDLTLQPQSMSAQHRFGGSCDNLRTHQGVSCGTNSLHSTPVKQKQAFSHPSTPSIDTNVSNLPSYSRPDRGTISPEKSAIIIEHMTPSEVFSMSHAVVGNTAPSGSTTTTIDVMHYPSNSSKQNQLHQDSTLIGEIDQFLDSMKKNTKVQTQMDTIECNKKENTCNCGDYSSSIPDLGVGLRDFNKLPVREEVIKAKYIAPLEKEKTMTIKEADLHEFDQLLQEGENGLNDRKHPTPKAIYKQPCQQKKLYHCGDTETSVPDLAFGLRSFNSLPVREEEVKRKTVLPLGTDEMKGLELLDIEKLLKQMEATQHEIEQKLQLRESLIESSSTFSEKDHVSTAQNTSFAADTIGSVPDEGFGAGGVLSSPKPVPVYNKPSCNGARVPVHEERATKKNISLLGTEVASDKTHCPQVYNGIEQHTNRQNIHVSNAETIEETERPPQMASNYLAGQEDSTKVSVARRKLELGDNAATIPDCGFGLKRWYNSENNKNGSSESVLHLSNNIPRSVYDGVIPSHSSDGRSAASITSKNMYVEGGYLPSIPDLGFGLRKLWTNNVLPQGLEQNTISCNPKSHTSAQTQIHHMQTNSDLNAAEYSLSQPRVTAGETDHICVRDQWNNISTRSQSHSLAKGDRGSALTDTAAKKKMDLNGGSSQGSFAIMQQEEGSEAGVRKKPGYGNSFHESGVSSMVAPVSSGTSNLLSLSELWNKDGSSSASQIRNEHTNMRVRLEEEKYRRQHCERLIQQLQIRLLEEQQKLAVAVQVDRRKDQAILQLQDAWSHLVHHWKVLEEQRHNLATRLLSEREAHQTQEFEVKQKLKRLESELSKALDLAQGYKEKLDSVEKEKQELIEEHNSEIKGMMDRIQEEGQKLDKANQLNCQLIQQKEDALEKMKEAEQEAQKERKLLIDAQREVEDTHKKLYSFEAELSALKEERETLQLKLKEEKGRIGILDQQKRSLQATLDENKKKEKSIREEMKQLTAQSERIKVELREYYQEQLEVVVRDKLREFQEQLDAAETSLHKELEQREHALTEMASKQVKQISEKHQLEMQLLEEKHAEEFQLYKLQLAQAVQQISQLEAKLQGYNSRKSEMVEKLHSVMETQWQEALRIVSGSSPLVTHGAGHKRLQMAADTPFKDHVGMSQSQVPPVHLQQNTGSSTADEMPFSRDGLLTFRKAEQPVPLQATSVSRGSLKINQEGELKKYIMMLLDRSPGNPVDEGNQPPDLMRETHDEKLRQDACIQDDKQHQLVDIPTNEGSQHPKWEKIFHGTELNLAGSQHQSINSVPSYDLPKSGLGLARDVRHVKPPWK